jgi:uncharacterized protein (DUF2235 family)
MGKNIVICCDGTGNQVEGNLSNILKLFRILRKSDEQRVYYNPGIGTIGTDDPWLQATQNAKGVFGLATGYGLDAEILGAYRFIAEHYQEDDRVFLFGFSRGAYTVRALAGFIHMAGLLPPDQVNIADYALVSYKRSSEKNDLHLAWDFGNVTGGRQIAIKLIGVWDTVASMIVPRSDRLVPTMQTLPYTFRNPSVEIFRHAMAIDERRRLFRLNRWKEPQDFVAKPFDTEAPKVSQDIKQVWFAGVHSDVGGGYPESESGLSKFPLDWMIEEAVEHGLQIDEDLKSHLVFGKPYLNSKKQYVAPDATAKLHQSMTPAWRTLEWLPKCVKYEEWTPRLKLDGFYIPDAEPRMIENDEVKPCVHQSAVDRKRLVPDYKPVNFPENYDIEPWPYGQSSDTQPSIQPPPA